MNVFRYLVHVLGLTLLLHTFIIPAHAGSAASCSKIFKTILEINSQHLASTFGVEMELRHPDHMSSWDVARKLEAFFKAKGFDDVQLRRTSPASMDDFVVTYKNGNDTRQWSFPEEPDFYWADEKKYPGFELTTPIMRTEEDQNLLAEVLHHLKSFGVTPARDIGGTHVHWGANQITYGNIERIYLAYQKAYDKLKIFFEPDSGRGNTDISMLDFTIQKIRNTRNFNKLVSEDKGAGHFFYNGPIKYNVGHNTLETRIFNSTTNVEEIIFNIKFSRAFILKVLNDDDFFRNLDHMNAQQILQRLDIR